MYNVGQGDCIKDGGGKVFSINYPDYIADTLLPCHYRKVDDSRRPKQIPLGSIINSKDFNYRDGYESVEHYVDTTQQTKAGEISDGAVLVTSIALMLLLFYIFRAKKF